MICECGHTLTEHPPPTRRCVARRFVLPTIPQLATDHKRARSRDFCGCVVFTYVIGGRG